MKDRLNLFIAAMAMAIICLAALTQAAEVNLAWDFPDEPADTLPVDGFALYTHPDGGEYGAAAVPTHWGWSEQFCVGSDCSWTLPYEVTEKLYITARSFCANGVGSDQKDLWTFSEPSNEAVFNPLDTNAVDDDGDGFSENDGDCNDQDDTIYPGASEICGDGIDQDCSGADLACDPTEPPLAVTVTIEATEGSYIYDGTNWYKITATGFELDTTK